MAADVIFEEESFSSDKNTYQQKEGGLIGLMINLKLAKDRKNANVILVILFILLISFTSFLLFHDNSNSQDAEIIIDAV